MDPPSGGGGGVGAASTSSTRIGGILREASLRDVPLPFLRKPRRDETTPRSPPHPPPSPFHVWSSRRNLRLSSPYSSHTCVPPRQFEFTRVCTHKVSRKSLRPPQGFFDIFNIKWISFSLRRSYLFFSIAFNREFRLYIKYLSISSTLVHIQIHLLYILHAYVETRERWNATSTGRLLVTKGNWFSN